MLDEKNKEKKSKRKELEEVAIELRNRKRDSFYDNLSLTRARNCENNGRMHNQRVMAELLELTPEEMAFKQADEEEFQKNVRLNDKEREEIYNNSTREWWNISRKIARKEYINEIKKNYKLMLAAQEELDNKLSAVAKGEEGREWFKSLSFEWQKAVRLALRKQRESCIKLQNEMLQIWEDEIVGLQRYH